MPAGPRPRYCSVAYGLILIAGDCLAVFAVVMSVWWASAKFWPKHEALLAAGDASSWRDFMILLAAIFVYIAVKGRYHEPIPFWVQTRVLTCACFCAIGIEMISRLLRNEEPPLNVIIALLALPVLATAIDCISKQNLKSAGLWALPVVLISDRPSEAEAAFAGHDYRFVGHASPGEVLAGSAPNRIRSVIDRYSARLVLIVTDGKLQRQVIACALSEGVPFVLVPAWPVPAFPFKLICIFGQDTLLLSFQGGVSRPVPRTTKVVFDVVVAALLLVILSPPFLILMTISCLDGSSPFYTHKRIGAGGKPFNCLKFRTMVPSADRMLGEMLASDSALAVEWAATRKLINDPRVTRMGRFLRKSSLDELPQLINVLRLEMSLVGPRPIVGSEIPLYGQDFATYCAVRPGVTGLWQVSGRSRTSYKRRVKLDVWYVNNWSLWHDIVILLKTIPAVLGGLGAR